MNQFVKDSEVLNSPPFIDYEVQYHIMHRIADTEFSLLLADEDHSVIIGRSSADMPFHVFFSDSVSTRRKEEVFFELADEIKPNVLKLMTASEHIEAVIKAAEKSGGKYKLNLKTNAYECKNLIKPPYINGFRKAEISDSEIIAVFLESFNEEALGEPTIASLDDAREKITAGGMYLLTKDSKIVAMGNITHRSPRHARINCIYTVPEYRRRGLCKEITARLSEVIFKEGLLPCLFADCEYEPSNRAYRAIGFVKKGEMANLTIEFSS